MIENRKIIDIVHKFDIIKDRLGNFCMKILNQSHIHLCEVVKLCLVLSHSECKGRTLFLS